MCSWHLWYNDGIRKHPDNVCETEFSDSVMFKITTSIANFIIPMSLMVIIYYKIFREIKRRVDNVDENEATSQCQTSLGSPQIISTHHKLIRSLLNPFIKRRHQTTLCPINGNVPSSVTRIGGSDKTPIGGDTNVKSVPMTNHQSLSNTALDNVGSSARVLISSESTPPLAPPPPPPPPISVPINHSEEQTTSMAITATTSTTDQLAPFLRDMRLEQLSISKMEHKKLLSKHK
ncbi:Histamine H1 receptor [Blomia tropicalis]|nr:Histamine H1 receptor [Blomia tropicalis]